MAKFRQVQRWFVPAKRLEFWGNLFKNYDNSCSDDDFFDIVRYEFDHGKAVELIEAAYTPDELREMEEAKNHRERLDLSDSLEEVLCTLWNNADARGKCKAVLAAMCDYMKAGIRKRGTDISEGRLLELRRALNLNDIETELLTLAFICAQWGIATPSRTMTTGHGKLVFYAMALDRSIEEVTEALAAHGTLRKFSLLDDDLDFDRHTLGAYMAGVSNETIDRRFYFKSNLDDTLPWSYFGERAERDGDILKRMLGTCAGRCNILVYGAPGTGKTSFARALAKELGRTAFEIRQGDEDGNMCPNVRMIGIHACNGKEDPACSLMIVDEADELLSSATGGGHFSFAPRGGHTTEKGVTNTVLDEMRMPAIWISNASPREMDESVCRRFDYSIRFRSLDIAQREAIWRNQVEKHGLSEAVSGDMIRQYAAEFATSAGGISTVLSNVSRMAPAPDKVDELIRTLMRPHCELLGLDEGTTEFMPSKNYSLDGLCVRGKVKPARIVRAMRNFLSSDFNAGDDDRPRMNVLLYGPPGTGKTEFVKYVGKELGRKVVVVRGSDLLDKFVGETEKRISQAFREAEAGRAVLFFDEVDGLLANRAGAVRNWEVTQVNEILQQMENFDGVMIAATNFSRNLDPAAMRRFTFKLEFDYLDEGGKEVFFERFFKTPLTEGERRRLRQMRNLTPGDFRTARQELYYLGDEVTNDDRLEALSHESTMKREGAASAPSIGFAV